MGTFDLLQNISLIVIIHIVLIDLLLSADNAMLIALACRHLDPARRKQGIFWGTLGAVVLRLALISVALSLLNIPGLKIAGGLMLAWIAMRLLQKPDPDHIRMAGGVTLMAAIKTIVVADFLMSLDNVLAVAGAVHTGMPAASAQVQFSMVFIGLLVSVPLMILASSVILKVLDRFPLLVLAGVGLLGWIAGGMVVTDVLVLDQVGEVSTLVKLSAQTIGALVVIVVGRYWAGAKQAR